MENQVTVYSISQLVGDDDEGLALAHMTGVELPSEEQLPLPYRFYADFTGLHAAADAERLNPSRPRNQLEVVRQAQRENVTPRYNGPNGPQEVAAGGVIQNVRDVPLLAGGNESILPKAVYDRLIANVDQSVFKTGPGASTMVYVDGNPKTGAGAKKPDLSVIPPTSMLHLATAMMNGATKYGPFNWRDQPISVRPYVTAMQRHILAYLDGEDFSADTTEAGAPVHHLAHAMACCAILLDAMECGTLTDNRPKVKGRTGQMIEFYAENKRFAAA
jgi:hypothetical protein